MQPLPRVRPGPAVDPGESMAWGLRTDTKTDKLTQDAGWPFAVWALNAQAWKSLRRGRDKAEGAELQVVSPAQHPTPNRTPSAPEETEAAQPESRGQCSGDRLPLPTHTPPGHPNPSLAHGPAQPSWPSRASDPQFQGQNLQVTQPA